MEIIYSIVLERLCVLEIIYSAREGFSVGVKETDTVYV